MRTTIRFLIILGCILLAVQPSRAQEVPDAWSLTGLNLRVAPDPNSEIVVVLPPDAELYIEARTADYGWVLTHTTGGVFRGWVSVGHLRYRQGFSFDALPASAEMITDLTAPPDSAPVMAVVSAWARTDIDVRVGPSAGYPSLSTLPAMTGLVLEGRNADGSWILGHTSGGSVRGWVITNSLYFRKDLELMVLGVLDQMMPLPSASPTAIPTALAAVPPAAENPPVQPPVNAQVTFSHATYDPARVASIDLGSYPVIPASMGQARAIFQRGQALGANPHVVAKVGDCSSALHFFLTPFGQGNYNLGTYTNLQGVIDQFSESLTYGSLAASPGFVAGAVLDTTWADPSMCQEGESPLQCEYRVHRPSVAVIMFGTQDVFLMSPDQFDSSLREILDETIQAGIIPIMSTFPSHLAHWDNTILYNQIVIRVALDYNVPVMNLWLALEGLPNHGVQEDGNHLSNPITDAGDLNGDNLDRGFPMRNLVTLQALNAVWRGAMN